MDDDKKQACILTLLDVQTALQQYLLVDENAINCKRAIELLGKVQNTLLDVVEDES